MLGMAAPGNGGPKPGWTPMTMSPRICLLLKLSLTTPLFEIEEYSKPTRHVDVNKGRGLRRSVQWRAEAVGCPGPTRFLDALENILYSSRKISDDLFLVVHLNFSLFSHQLSNFTRIRSLDAP